MVLAYLMHKDIICMSFYMNQDGRCCKTGKVFNKQHIPPSVNGSIYSINRFLNMRQLNENRKDVNKIKNIELFNDSDFYPFHFLSPFDCYWVRYDGELMPFNSVSLYQNPYRTDIFNFTDETYMEIERDSANLSLSRKQETFYVVPEESYQGRLLTICSIQDKSVAIQDIYAKYLNVLKGVYSVYKEKLFFDVPNITSDTLEYLTFNELYLEFREDLCNSGYTEEESIALAMQRNNLPEWELFLSHITALDNEYHINRTVNDFGVLRNPDTLDIQGFAPICLYPE